jgi:hypothetical protein
VNTTTAVRQPREPAAEKPAWLAALDGLCQPCADAEFYGTRRRHADCEHGDCECQYVIPAVWPAGTWAA